MVSMGALAEIDTLFTDRSPLSHIISLMKEKEVELHIPVPNSTSS